MNSNEPSTLPISLFLGLRFFAGTKRGSIISFISGVAIVGLATAIALLVLVLSVMNGFEKEFRERILGFAPHTTLWLDVPTQHWQVIADAVSEDPSITAVYPMVELKAMALSGNDVKPLLVQGIDYDSFSSVIKPYLNPLQAEGDAEGFGKGDIIIGAQIASSLNVKAGDRLRLLIPSATTKQKRSSTDKQYSFRSDRQSNRIKTASFRIYSVLTTGTEIDNNVALLSLADAQKVTNTVGVKALQLQVDDLFAARSIGRRAAINNGLAARVSDWTQSFGNLYTAIQLSRQMVALLLTTIIAVAAFNVFVTLGMVVRSKQEEIAIVRTIGMSRRGILLSFIAQGMLITVAGCVLGLILGCFLATAAPSFVDLIQSLLGIEFLQTDVYPINYLPSEIRIFDLIWVCTAALVMSFLATLYPAQKATKVLPADALRQL